MQLLPDFSLHGKALGNGFIKERNLFLVFVQHFCTTKTVKVYDSNLSLTKPFKQFICTNNESTLLPTLYTTVEFIICVASENDAWDRKCSTSSVQKWSKQRTIMLCYAIEIS